MSARQRSIAAAGAFVLVAGMVTYFATGRTADVRRAVAEPESRDYDVLETVLVDLLEYQGADSPLTQESHTVLFDLKAAPYPQTVEEVLYEHEPWTLPPAQRTASREAAEHLVRRIHNHDTIGELRVLDPRIRIHTSVGEENGSLLSANRPIKAWTPGFSKDRQLAVVRLVIPWSMHHAEGTFLLAEANQKWTVVLRQFVYYP